MRVKDIEDIPKPKTQPEHTANKAEELLKARGTIIYATCGDYVYYMGYDAHTIGGGKADLYRMKTNGTADELLQNETHITRLMAMSDKLFSLAWLPEGNRNISFCALDKNGRVKKIIDTGLDGEWVNSECNRFGNLVMFQLNSWGSSETALQTLYDPLTGATFYAFDKKEGD